jgi:gluconate 2-dehydrogenase gamma chain
MDMVTRRSFVATVGAATVVPATALLSSAARSAVPVTALRLAGRAKPPYIFFSAAEALFIEAACERLIPADETGPGARAAGVPNYLDWQLGGAWGTGERLYRSGPWQPGTPSQGRQPPFMPAEFFHTCLRAIERDLEAQGTAFHDLSGEAQDAYLKCLESGAHDLDGVSSAVFFDMLLKMSVEGFFIDPVYGGRRDMVGWRVTGFPGAFADCVEAVDQLVHVRHRFPANLRS